MKALTKLAALAAVAEAARRYAQKNPQQAGRYVDEAARFVDKQTKGRYSSQIQGAARKAKGVAGIHEQRHGYVDATANGTPGGYGTPRSTRVPGQEPPTTQYRP